jgi:formylglycine-generating enzyme required for sulfatase activity
VLRAFCIWDGGFLPSETEWEYAAAGGSEQREYPWGSTDPGAESEYAIYGSDYRFLIAPVGTATKGAGRWGQLDLVGDVFEWTLDYWDAQMSFPNPCNDCARLTPTPYRAVRGGSYYVEASFLTPPYRPPVEIYNWRNRYTDVGFRCARSP